MGKKMSNKLVSEFFSDSGQKTAMVFTRGDSGYRVTCLDSYFEVDKEFYFDTLLDAENFAEDWVL